MLDHFTTGDVLTLGGFAVALIVWLVRLEMTVKTERVRVDEKFAATNRDVDLQIGFMRETMKRIEGLFHSIDAKIDRRNLDRDTRDGLERDRWRGGAE